MAKTPVDPALLAAAYTPAPATLAQWLPILPVALCLLAAAVLMMLRERTRQHPAVALPVLALVALIDIGLVRHVAADGPITTMMGHWRPPFGIAFTVDLTGALFALAAALVGLAAGFYGLVDINTSGRRYGFYPFLLVLVAGVSGAFLTGDIFNLYVWFEVLLIASFGMLILGSEQRQIDGALKYAVLNLIATTLFLITIGFLYGLYGTLNMADLALRIEAGGADRPMMTLAVLFTLAFAMKAAAFPVNFWLPAAYHTPRVTVSALFAALLTKVGIYSLLRVVVMLMPLEREALSLPLAVIAAATMILGALGALAQNDARRLLGFVVISGVGAMLAGIAIGGIQGLSATIVYGVQSILLMAALYMALGLAERLTGQSQLSAMGGLHGHHPLFSLVMLGLVFAASGLPPFAGFWPKMMLLKAALDIGAWWLAASLLIAAFLTLIALARLYLFAFWRPEPEREPVPVSGAGMGSGREAAAVGRPEAATLLPVNLVARSLLPVGLLALPLLAIGFFPEWLISHAQDAAGGLLDRAAYVQSVFPGGPR